MKIQIIAKSPFLIGGYANTNPFVDKSTARLENGTPIIPASVIKGAIRVEFERLYSPACTREDELERCPACYIFGRKEDHRGLIIFSDAEIEANGEIFSEYKTIGKNGVYHPTGGGYTERPGVVINRKTRTAEENMLFLFETTEYFPQKTLLSFAADLHVSPDLIRDATRLSKFKAAVNAVFAIGGSKSRGMGLCEFKLIEAEESVTVDSKKEIFKGSVIKVELQLKSRHLTIGANKPYQHFVQTLDYVPGSSVRGALAKAIARKMKESSKAENVSSEISNKLKILFSDSDLIFDDCLVSSGYNPARILPSSARSCKVYQGFQDESEIDDPMHGVIDAVIQDIVWQYANLPIAFQPHCYECNEDLAPFTGYYEITSDARYKNVVPLKRVVTRSAQNRKLRNSQEGQLFSIESVEKPATTNVGLSFAGSIRNVSPEIVSELTRWDDKMIQIGAEASTGYGGVAIKMKKGDSPSTTDIQQRIAGFNEKLKKQLSVCKQKWGALCKISREDENSLYFTIDLLSNSIILKNNGLYAGILEKDILKKHAGISAELIRSYARTELVSGWSIKESGDDKPQQIPKRVQQAITRGSVFVFRINGIVSPPDDLLTTLQGMESQGIGTRCQEGYGHIKICDEFHYAKEVY